MFESGRWRIFPGDEVYVNHGPYARQAGKVLEVIKDRRVPQVLVEGVNLRKKKVYTGKGEDEFFCGHHGGPSSLLSSQSDAAGNHSKQQ